MMCLSRWGLSAYTAGNEILLLYLLSHFSWPNFCGLGGLVAFAWGYIDVNVTINIIIWEILMEYKHAGLD